jgi:hypothetical protein
VGLLQCICIFHVFETQDISSLILSIAARVGLSDSDYRPGRDLSLLLLDDRCQDDFLIYQKTDCEYPSYIVRSSESTSSRRTLQSSSKFILSSFNMRRAIFSSSYPEISRCSYTIISFTNLTEKVQRMKGSFSGLAELQSNSISSIESFLYKLPRRGLFASCQSKFCWKMVRN